MPRKGDKSKKKEKPQEAPAAQIPELLKAPALSIGPKVNVFVIKQVEETSTSQSKDSKGDSE